MRTKLFAVALLSLAAYGCGEEQPPSLDCPATGGTGALSITVTGLPSGVAGKVQINNSGDRRDVGAGGTIEGLASGEWNVAGDVVATSGGLVRAAYHSGTGQIVCVQDGETTNVTIDYGLIPSSQKLWLSTSNGAAEVQAYGASLLESTATVSASVLLSSKPAIPRASGIAFDRVGNLWVALGSGELRRYPADQLGASGEKSPDVIITGEKLSKGVPGPVSIAFDRNGSLWVSVGFSDTVLSYLATDLGASGSPAPHVELTGVGDPQALAFDKSGDLWVADHTTGKPRIHMVRASSLGASGAVTPSLSIDGMRGPPASGSLGGAAGLAFDATGNLWAAYGASGLLAKYTPAELARTGEQTVTPSVVIEAGGPKELAFDEAGNLWMAYNAGKISRLGPPQLEASGKPTPEVVLDSSDLGATFGVAVYPAPANLPLYHALP